MKGKHHKRASGGDVEPMEDKWVKESEGSHKEPNEEGDTPEKKRRKKRSAAAHACPSASMAAE